MADKYVDFSATYDGDGTAANQASGAGQPGAYNTIVGKTFTGGDLVWLRRAGSITLAAGLSLTVASVSYIGWPISSDEDYSSRPASGTSNGWDSDADTTYPTITTTNYAVTVQTNGTQTFKRIKFSGASATSSYISVTASIDSTWKYCVFDSQQTGSSNIFVKTTASTHLFKSCAFTGTGACARGNLLYIDSSSKVSVHDCSVDVKSVVTVSGAFVAVLLNMSTSGHAEFLRCTFDICVSDIDYTPSAIACGGLTTSTVVLVDCVASIRCGGYYYSSGQLALAGVGICCLNFKLDGGVNVTMSGGLVHLSKAVLDRGPSGTQAFVGNDTSGLLCIEGASVAGGKHGTPDISSSNAGNIRLRGAEGMCRTQMSALLGSSRPCIIEDLGQLGVKYLAGGDCEARSCNVTRSGGGTVLQCGGWYGPLYTGTRVFKPLMFELAGFEQTFVDLIAGDNVVTLYGAHKNYLVAPTNDDIWMEIVYRDQSSGARRAVVTTKAATALTSDTSTWSGDDGLTRFKLVANVHAEQAGLCPVRIRFKKYDSDGRTYLDLTPVVS